MIISKRTADAIVNFAEARAFVDEETKLMEDAAKFVEDVRVAWNGGPEMCATVDALPVEFFRTTNGSPDWHLSRDFLRQPTYKPAGATSHPDYRAKPFENRYANLKSRYEDLKSRRSKLGSDLRGSLTALRTTKKVREAYPEFAGMLPDEPVANAPAIWQDMEAIRASLLGAGVIPVDAK